MYTNHYSDNEYPFEGTFYTIGIDDSLPLDEQTEGETSVFSTSFDMAGAGTSNQDSFQIYFPFDNEAETLTISVGNIFKGTVYGMEVKGRVTGIFPSSLGGCTVSLIRI